MSLTNQELSLVGTFSIFIIITSIIIFFVTTGFIKYLALFILLIYVTFILSSIGFISAIQFGIGGPVLFYLIIACILLIILLSINTKTYSKSCYSSYDSNYKCPIENFTPRGPSVLPNGKWCDKINGECLRSDGTLMDDRTTKINSLKSELQEEQKKCNLDLEKIKNEINKERKLQNSSYGPCITSDKKWGVILPEFGRKCISMDILKKYGNNSVKKADTNKKISSKNKKKIIKKNYPPSDEKELTKCYPSDTNFNKKCQEKYGKRYGLYKLYDCKTKDMGEENYKEASCAFGYDKGNRIKFSSTECHPLTDDFNFWCEYTFGKGYGSKKVLKGKKYCKYETEGKAECSKSYYDDTNMYINMTDCEPKNTDFDALCMKKYNKPMKSIGGYDCFPGKFRAYCDNPNN